MFIRTIAIALCGGHMIASSDLPGADMAEFQKAMEYIETNGGEVYISFPLSDSLRLDALRLSIDKITEREVFAYLNKKEFEEFAATNIPYRVRTHPGDLLPNPGMSDYSGDTYRIAAYPTYEGYLKIMADFEKSHPAFCAIHTIGESVNGRKLLVAKLSDSVTIREKEPRYFMSATIHGNETAGYLIALNMIELLLTKYDSDARIKRIVDSAEVWICPLMNPDGTYRSGNSTVAGARRENANGRDLNRDFPDPVSGPYPNGDRQKETQHFIDFESEYDFVMTSDLHGGSELACYPWGCSWSKVAADDEWWKLISRNYAASAQKNGPDNYFTGKNNGIVNGIEWYPVTGGRMSYALYFRHTRLLTLELSVTQLLPESVLDDYWNYNKDALLGHIEEVFNGIRGTVTDTFSAKGIRAKVVIKNHDKDSSFVYSMEPHGDYYRPVFRGAYDVEFSHVDYHTKVIAGVSVENGRATVIDARLRPLKNGIAAAARPSVDRLALRAGNGEVVIQCPDVGMVRHAALYSPRGALVKRFGPEHFLASKTIRWDGNDRFAAPVQNGCYILSIQTRRETRAVRFFLLRN